MPPEPSRRSKEDPVATRVSNNFSPNTSPQSTRSSMRRSVLSLAIFASTISLFVVSMAGCGPGVIHTSISNPSLRATADSESEVTHDGLTISVRPITWENGRTFSSIFRTFTGHTARGTVTAGPGPIAPLPAFEVRIVNHTGHVVRFTQSIIRLSDNLSRQYQLMANAGELDAWAQSAWHEALAYDPGIGTQITSAIGSLQLFTRNTELLNGDEWVGYAVFTVPASTDAEYRTLLDSLTRLTLRIAEVPVETDDAGTVSRTTEFTFNFDRSEYAQAVACRGRAPASWDPASRCVME